MSANNESRRLTAERVYLYDWLRFLATILVVIGHSSYLEIRTVYGGISYALPDNISPLYFGTGFSLWRDLVGWIYTFHMPLFFMLSGAVLALKPIDRLGSVLKSKSVRLLLPYLVYGYLFMFPIKRLAGFYDNTSLQSALRGFLWGQDSGHLWFLPALFWVIVIFVVLQIILKKFNIQNPYLLLFTAGIGQLASGYLPFDFLCLKQGLGYLLFFALGYVFESERKKAAPWKLPTTLLVFLALAALELINLKTGMLGSFFTTLSRSLMLYTLAYGLDRFFKNVHQKKWWKFIAGNLFYVYIFHDPLEYMVLKVFFSTDLLSGSIGCIAYVLCRTLVVFALSLLIGAGVTAVKKQFSNRKNRK